MSETRQRRPHSWAVLELTRMGERKAEEGVLAPLLRQVLHLSDSHPVFVPCTTYVDGARRVTVHLMQGYAFVSADGAPLHLPQDQLYVKRFMSTKGQNGGRVLSVVTDDVVRKMEADLSSSVSEEIQVGSKVSISSGVYRGLHGEVIDVFGDDVVVRFTMRSLDTLVTMPRDFAVPAEEVPSV